MLVYKDPVVHGDVDVYIDVDIDSRGQWRPAVISVAIPPGNPTRTPFTAGDPNPSIPVVVVPSSIMERGPTPVIIRDPGPAIISICPVSIRTIWMETGTGIRDPDLAVFRHEDPVAVRT
jgi:hypothetical protein